MLQTLRWRQPLQMLGLYNQKMNACNGNPMKLLKILYKIMEKPVPVTLEAVVVESMPSEYHLLVHFVALLAQLSQIFEPRCPLSIKIKTIEVYSHTLKWVIQWHN